MKAIICDTCGKSVPDTKVADIMDLFISYEKPGTGKKFIERDICPECLESLILFFEPHSLDKLTNEIIAEVERQYKSEPEPEVSRLEPAISEGFTQSETLTKETETYTEVPPAESFMHETTFEVENPKVPESLKSVEHITTTSHVSFKPAEDIREIKPVGIDATGLSAIKCANCDTLFVPKNKLAKCCSYKCGQQKWYKEQKLKNETPEQKKIRTDAILKKLKEENPVNRNDERPSIYREM